jgi:hypothetical protein
MFVILWALRFPPPIKPTAKVPTCKHIGEANDIEKMLMVSFLDTIKQLIYVILIILHDLILSMLIYHIKEEKKCLFKIQQLPSNHLKQNSFHFLSTFKDQLIFGFSYILEVSFIGGGKQSTRRKPQTCRKSLPNFIT